ncbi:MAG: HAD family hydrolase [Marinifilaceae bacterium]
MKRFLFLITALALLSLSNYAQTYRKIEGWDNQTNKKIERFLNGTKDLNERKVAVFDGDGTVFGQVPHYLADEALYRYADLNYKGKTDSLSLAKMKILNDMVADGDNVGKSYVEQRVHFLSGMTVEEVENMGMDCYLASYPGKFYPEMKQFLENLKEYGFEIWVITASPEILYQKFIGEELGIPDINIIGVKSVIENDRLTGEIILPIPQDDGKASVIPTFIKAKPLVVGGNSRGDMDMLNQSVGIKMVVNPDDKTVRGKQDGPMSGKTVKQYWEGVNNAIIVNCEDVTDPNVEFHTGKWGIKTNMTHPKQNK